MPTLAPASREEIQRRITRALLGRETASDTAFDCALVRTTIWDLTEHGSPAHVLRVINRMLSKAFSLFEGLDEGVLRRRYRNALAELAQLGDVVELPNGFWYPAPTREVALEVPGQALLVGGVPSSVMTEGLREAILHDGALRRVQSGLVSAELQVGTESLDSWLSGPATPLIEWANELLGSELFEVDEVTHTAGMRFYVAHGQSRGLPQRFRWRDSAAGLFGRVLIEVAGNFGVREFRVAEVHDGRVTRAGASLLPGEARRLMYGQDILAKNPVEVALLQSSDSSSFVLRSELPRPELRLFRAIGELSVQEGAYYPRTWRFTPMYAGLALARLAKLGISIISSSK